MRASSRGSMPGSLHLVVACLLASLIVPFQSQEAGALQSVDPVTFTRDVAPILQRNCEACHQPGSIGPMALRSYDEVRPWAPIIRDRVEKRLMPPWPIDRTVGIQEFKNDAGLTDEQIATICSGSTPGRPRAIRRICRLRSRGPMGTSSASCPSSVLRTS